jgi:hypothetical protein
MENEEDFIEAAKRELAFLVDEYGFRVVEETDTDVRFESPAVAVVAAIDRPRSEVEVFVGRRGHEYGTLSFGGMIGQASAVRLLEMAAAELRAHEWALEGDENLYDQLAFQQRRESREWTAYNAGRGPRPSTRKLP